MPDRRIANAVRLEFEPGALVHAELSGAACAGEWLWVTGDEACGVSRLRRLDPVGRETPRYGEENFFPLADLLDLPGDADDETDLEGMALADGYLWVVGSRGVKRKKVDPRRDHVDHAQRLASPAVDRNRRLLACLPVELDADARPRLVRQAKDGRLALRLKGDAKSNPLTEALADDPHIGPFLKIPGKDNGFAARPALAANREPVRFQFELDKSVPLPHGNGTNRAEAICDLPTELARGKPAWLVLYDAPGDDRKEGENTVYVDLLRRE